MAATIPDRQRRRRGGTPWSLALLAMLLLFWKFVGGAGGWLPGTGTGRDQKDHGDSRPAGSRAENRESTVRRAATASPPTATLATFDSPGLRAKVNVAPPRDQSSGGRDVKLTVMKDGREFRGPGRVEVLPQEPRPDSRGAAPEAYKMVAGTATIPGTRTGEVLRVRILADGEKPVTGTLAVTEGEATLDLAGIAFITGQAVFADGEIFGNQDLVARWFRASKPDETSEVHTNIGGAFRLEVPAGQNVLLELAPRGAVKGEDVAAVVFQRDSLEPGSLWDLGPATFQREVVLAEGTVEDKNGNPVANASVTALPVGLATRALTTRSDASGRFVVKGPPDVASFDLIAATENDAARLAGPPLARGAAAVRLVLVPAGGIRGSLVVPALSLSPLVRVELKTAEGNLVLATHGLADGSFEFPHVPAGDWTIAVGAPGGEPVVVSRVAVAEGAVNDLKAIETKSSFVPKTLRVIDSSGAPVAGAQVEVVLTPAATLRARTDASGTAALVAPASGEVAIAVEAAGLARWRGAWDGARAITLNPRRAESSESAESR